MTIFEPLGLEEELSSEAIERARSFQHFLYLYRSQSWDSAEELLSRLLQDEPDSYLYRLYLERIDLFRENRPPPTGMAYSPTKRSRSGCGSGCWSALSHSRS